MRTVRPHSVCPYVDTMPPRTWVTWALQGSFCLPRTHYIYPPLSVLHYLSSFRSTVAAAYHALPPQPVALFITHVATHPSIHISGRILPFSLSYIGRSMLTPPTLVKSSHMFVRFCISLCPNQFGSFEITRSAPVRVRTIVSHFVALAQTQPNVVRILTSLLPFSPTRSLYLYLHSTTSSSA